MTTDATRATPERTPHEPTWAPAVCPYLGVADGRRAMAWYVEVFDAVPRGEPVVMDDGTIGHAELDIGDGVLMLAGGSPSDDAGGGTTTTLEAATGIAQHSVHLHVPDVDATVARALAAGATLQREPADQPHGRAAAVYDPFGHRWYLLQPPAHATRARHGDTAYVTIAVPDAERAKRFLGAVLDWRFDPGSVPDGWQVEDTRPAAGLAGGADAVEVQLCFRVDDVDAAAVAVRGAGGTAGEPQPMPYGRLVDCTDDQGLRCQLWQPEG